MVRLDFARPARAVPADVATFVFRPLTTWPGPETPSYRRQRSKFQSSWTATLDLLHRELDALNAKDIVISLALEPKDLTRDQTPRSGARPRMPGVVLSFSKRVNQPDTTTGRDVSDIALQFPCDTFDSWESNVRAIALALEALRKIDRYGVTRRNEQYQGWAQLPASTANNGMTPQQAAETIARTSDFPWSSILDKHSVARDAVRQALNRSHPDRGGSQDVFVRVQKAREVLATHHKVSL